jgi:phosphatidylglycerol:prolipoprotein diacylglycerol transferase
MWPSIEPLPGVRVWSWGLFNGLAALAVLLAGLREAPRRGVPRAVVLGLWPYAVLGGILGAHVYYLLAANRAAWSSWGWAELLNPVQGQAIQGGMLGGGLALWTYLRRAGRPILPVLDALAPGGAVAHALTRLGCFAAGCCYGSRTGLPWAVTFTDPRAGAPLGVPLHPAQLYEAALDLALAGWLHRELGRSAAPGGVFWRYVGGYGVIRLCVQFLRDDDAGHLVFGMAHSQYLAAGMILSAVLMMRFACPER